MNDQRLGELYLRGLESRETAPQGGGTECAVAPDDLLALARGVLPEARRLELLDRVMTSARCRQELDLLRAVVAAEREAAAAERAGGPGEPVAAAPLRVVAGGVPRAGGGAGREGEVGRRWPRRAAVPAALAATLLLAVGLGGFLRDRPGAAEVTRGADDGVAVIAPAETIRPGAPVRFAWHPVPGATRYDFELTDAGGATVSAARRTADTTVALPAGVALQPGVDYRWLVTAVDEAGAVRGAAVRPLRVTTAP